MNKYFSKAKKTKSEPQGEGIKIKLTLSTHNGKVLDINEDNFFINEKTRPMEKEKLSVRAVLDSSSLLLGVCDGMGGEAMGDTASDIAARAGAELYGRLCGSDVGDFLNEVNGYADAANAQICAALQNDEARRGGSTFAVAYIRGDTVYAFSLGDSRIYLYSNGELRQITEDHTLAMRKYKANIYTREEAEQSMDSHKLTLFLGVDVDGNGLTAQWYQPFELDRGAKLLLCSDGLYDMCSKQEMERILAEPSDNHSKLLTNKALENGGKDNITCIVAELV